MTAALAIRSILELSVILLLLYGFYKEDKVIAFEEKVKMIIVVNYRRYKRRKKAEQLRNTQQPLHIVKGNNHRTPGGSFDAA